MATIEKISIALPSDMLAMVRQAVDGGDYASSSEVVREALREWKARRALQGDALNELRRQWQEGVDSGPSAALDVASSKRRARARLKDKLSLEPAAVPAAATPTLERPTKQSAGGVLLEQHRAAIEQLCRRYAVRRLAAFGSLLRADFDPATSDVDLAVEFADPPDASPARQYFDFKAELETLLGRPVDLVELNAMPQTRLKRIIERTQIPVFSEAA